MRINRLLACALLLGPLCGNAFAQQYFAKELRTAGNSTQFIALPTPPGTMETYFVNLQDGDVVHSPFRVVFGVTGLGICPAGFEKAGTGHHHLLVDTGVPSDLTVPIPFSAKYRHFGAGQTETELTLSPGKHTLQLLFADSKHRPLYKTASGSEIAVFSKKITITVVGDQKEPHDIGTADARATKLAQR